MTAALTPRERVSLALRELYQRYGYRQYTVGKFEEYDLYARNRNFLAGEHILTFTDPNGRLMALKPDVTLSVIRNTRAEGQTRKVWYTETVYRVPRNSDGFQEILQTGLECIGAVDLYTMGEVLMLSARSLEALGTDYVVDVSHMGLLTGVLSAAGAPAKLTADILAAAGEKNLHTLRALCAGAGLPAETVSLLLELCSLAGPVRETLPALLALPLPAESRAAAEELAAVCATLSDFGSYPVRLDLSVINDTDYYNGLLFRGFVDGVARPVLSGGRYDHLLQRMGRPGRGIGFAVYLSELERLLSETLERDADTLLVYSPEDDPARVAAAAAALTAAGGSVRVQLRGEDGVACGRKIAPDGSEVD